MMYDFFFNYVPGNSPIHKLDPRTKLIVVMVVSIFIFNTETFFELGIIAGFFSLTAFISGINYRIFLNTLRPMSIFFIFLFIIQLFLSEGVPIITLGFVHPTYEGLETGLQITTRFILLILVASLLTATTRPELITNGIERLLRPLPLRVLRVSSFDLATMMSLSIRFIPLLFDNAKKIQYLQVSRGMDFKHNIFKSFSSIAVPVIMSTKRTAQGIAIAMGSRCYQGKYRTSLFELEMKKADWIVLSGICVSVIFYLILA
ncbi:MAG: energy-coupling factor transporter transmembrane component T family protein [Methanohalobium sp.]|uniref:energy-coupling factor transporter transmembrane component T family protein n=1 Tax=Methanohalobium sp. TaxID=2837493 RepID=UPI00397E2583